MRRTDCITLTKVVLLAVTMLLTVGCNTNLHDSPDYYRHSLSQLSEPLGGGDYLWFDVMLTPEYPDNNAAAEAARMQWLKDWLAIRKICANGYTILERRPFDYMENNPAHYDLRYKVQCAVAVPAPN